MQQIAVKQLDRTNNCQQGEVEFLNEIVVLSTLNHPNVVNLRGYCSEDDHRLIVYEYMDRGSLDRVMYGMAVIHPSCMNKPSICCDDQINRC